MPAGGRSTSGTMATPSDGATRPLRRAADPPGRADILDTLILHLPQYSIGLSGPQALTVRCT